MKQYRFFIPLFTTLAIGIASIAFGNPAVNQLNICKAFYADHLRPSAQFNPFLASLRPISKIFYAGGETPEALEKTIANVNWKELLGKRIVIDLNSKDPNSRFGPAKTNQIAQNVLSIDMLNPVAKRFAQQVLNTSQRASHNVEAGHLHLVFKDGRYKSSDVFFGEEHSINIGSELNLLLKEIDWDSVAEINFIHTHPSKIPMPLSLTDKFLLFDRLAPIVPELIPIHFFAIPAHLKGSILFSQSRIPTSLQRRQQSIQVDGKLKKVESDQKSESAQTLFGSGPKLIIGFNARDEIYFVLNGKRYWLSKQHKEKILSTTSDQIEEGEFFVVNIDALKARQNSTDSKTKSFLAKMINPNSFLLDTLTKLTGLKIQLPLSKFLSLNPAKIKEQLKTSGLIDVDGNQIHADYWIFQNKERPQNKNSDTTSAMESRKKNAILGVSQKPTGFGLSGKFKVEVGVTVTSTEIKPANNKGEKYEEIVIDLNNKEGLSVYPPPSALNLFKFPYFQTQMGIRILVDGKTMIRPSNAAAYNLHIADYNSRVSEAEKIPFLVKDDFSYKGKTSQEVVEDWIQGYVFLNQTNGELHVHDNTFHMDRFLHLPKMVMDRSRYNYNLLVKLFSSEVFKGNEAARIYLYEKLGRDIDAKTPTLSHTVEFAKKNWNELILDSETLRREFQNRRLLTPEQTQALEDVLTDFIPTLDDQESIDLFKLMTKRVFGT